MKNRQCTRLCSVLLALVMLWCASPSYAFGEDRSENGSYVSDAEEIFEGELTLEEMFGNKEVAEEIAAKSGQGVVEIESLREENVKHYLMDDGTYRAVAYASPVHRKDAAGKWQDIDNRLLAAPAGSRSAYTTADGRFSVPSATKGGIPLFQLNEGNYLLSVSLPAHGEPDRWFGAADLTVVNHAEKSSTAAAIAAVTPTAQFEKLARIDNRTRLLYENIMQNVDIEYLLEANNVKENIIIKAPCAEYTYTFTMEISGLDAALLETGEILLNDEETGETQYIVPAPYMYDAEWQESYDVFYTLEESEEDCLTLTVHADAQWLNDPARVFPVTVDPTIYTVSGCHDTYIDSANPSKNYGSSKELWVQSSRISFIRIDEPTLPTYANVSNASLYVYYHYIAVTGSLTIGAYQCLHSWNENTFTWNRADLNTNLGLSAEPFDTAEAEASEYTTAEYPGQVNFNMTNIVKQWYAGEEDYGVALKYESGSNKSVILESRETGNAPFLMIIYNVVTPVVENGTYFIGNKEYENKFVQMDDGANTPDNAILEVWEFDGKSDQKWEFTYLNNGYYQITSSQSSYAISIQEGKEAKEDGSSVIVLQLYTASPRQQWKVFRTDSGAYKIKARSSEGLSSDLAMVVETNIVGSSNGCDVQQRKYVPGTSYKDEWKLIEHNSIYGVQEYREVTSTTINCHGYAMMSNDSPEFISENTCAYEASVPIYEVESESVRLTYSSLVKSDFENWLDVNEYEYELEDDFTGNGETRPLTSSQYRVVLRTGFRRMDLITMRHDYHFWYQTKDGTWANKHGKGSSEHLPSGVTPFSTDTSGWDVGSFKGFYNSPIYVYIITVKDS